MEDSYIIWSVVLMVIGMLVVAFATFGKRGKDQDDLRRGSRSGGVRKPEDDSSDPGPQT